MQTKSEGKAPELASAMLMGRSRASAPSPIVVAKVKGMQNLHHSP